MTIKYRGSVILVRDLKATRKFYEDILNQKVRLDHGECIEFIGGFSIWQIDHANNIMLGHSVDKIEIGNHGNNFELYFECEDIEDIYKKLLDLKAGFVHTLFEQPWGQRVFRIYDPEMNIVEIGEPMECVIKRFLGLGLSLEEVSKRASMPMEIVQRVADKKN
ncbi:MAG: glyoxalase/bleomycin resistance/dioxygenase family protein [Maledivibacter sp.]|jgi:predicted enzyme related to lactoylglutathione lyase|nr:glyoxalase/bleomycin resistance/dioxygenase family protein [Maledivibacter sp.]